MPYKVRVVYRLSLYLLRRLALDARRAPVLMLCVTLWGISSTTQATAQIFPDLSFPIGCKQNPTGTAASYSLASVSARPECKRGIPPKAEPWKTAFYANGVVVIVYEDDPLTLRDIKIAGGNAEQIRFGPSYTNRHRINPASPGCAAPYVNGSYAYGTRSAVTGYVACGVQYVDTRYPESSPLYVIDSTPFVFTKVLRCPPQWDAVGAGPTDHFGNYYQYPHFCVAQTPPKELGQHCPCEGNPITISNGNKYQAESDYVGSGPMPLKLLRHYNSLSSVAHIKLGANWRLEYDRRLVVEGSNSISVLRSSGKFYGFLLSGGTWIATTDIADRVSAIMEAGGNVSGWQYYDAGTQSTEIYSTTGLLLSITDLAGNVTTLRYSDVSTPAAIAPGVDFLVGVVDPFGRALGFTYAASGVLATAVDPSGAVHYYAYDASGNLASVTRPDGTRRTYHYNEPAFSGATSSTWLLTGITDENQNRFATYRYSSAGRAWSSEWAGGVNRFTVGSGATALGPFQVTTPQGYTKVFDMSRINQVRVPSVTTVACAATGCSGTQTETSAYDVNNNLTSYTDLRGVTTKRTYDLARNLEATRTEADGTAQARTISTSWHPTFRLPATVTEPVTGGSKVTTNTYDDKGNLTQRQVTTPVGTRTLGWTYDVLGRVLTATDPLGRVGVNTYYPNTAAQHTALANSRGMLASTTNAIGHSIFITAYTAHGQALAMTDANGLTTSMTYDARQRLISRTVGGETTTYEYDGVGQLKKVTLPDNSFLTYTYDGAHRLTQIQDGLGNKMAYTLDVMGSRIKEDAIDTLGALARTRSRVYDALNRLQRDIGGATPASQITQYAYDANGNQTSMTDPLNRVTSNVYDALNRLIRVNDPLNGAAAPTRYEYDAQDNLTKVTDPKNLATTYSYNGFNELVTQVSPDTGSTSFSYDAAGNMLTKTDARGVTVSYGYDSLNRVTSINYPATTSATGAAPAQTVSYLYDTCGNGKGRLCSFTDRTGTTAYSYDIQGRVLSKVQTVNGLAQTVAYRYNPAGQMDEMTMPSGKKVALSYTNNRVVGMSIDGRPIVKTAEYEPFGPIGEWTWGNDTQASPNKHTRYFDLDGRNTKVESGPTSGTSATVIDPAIIVYDAASRITALQRLTSNAVDPTKSATYVYDNLDRLTTATPGVGNSASTQSYSYDAIGNRLSNNVSGALTTYSYGTTSHRLNSLAGATAKTFGYDATGNRLTDGIQSWIYGGDGRPSAISLAGATPTSIQSGINALGQRVLKITNSGAQNATTRFVYDEAGKLIGEYDLNGRPIQETIWLNDLPVAVLK